MKKVVIRVKYRNDPSVSGFQQPLGGQSQYPGISDPFAQGGGMNTVTPVPFSPSLDTNIAPIVVTPAAEKLPDPAKEEGTAANKASGFSLNNLGGNIKDIQGIVERMGGLDGILSTVQKVQKVVSSVQQMTPLIKVLAGSFGKKGSAAVASTLDEDELLEAPPKRRKSRKKSGSRPLAGGQRRRPRRR
ncbi:hypothetical protein FHS18_004017 [Paenibacillus phyllosphaerae]|uniref:Tyrosine protein kinase n=1 Tax=Paenibacillus phyllosphaerae TaxID=274593 RepID=A0A7W5B036_9BACL|nr:tyrosine protein kinase [Paenibacillus phyllosphaerae]MBB3111949.1 hypothetical protein [Paenibacillus phyllosphaerae]